MQSQKFNKNVNWNVKETYSNLHINYMAEFDWIKLLRLKKYFHSVEVSSSSNIFLSNPYKIEVMITSLIEMLELPNLDQMTRSAI